MSKTIKSITIPLGDKHQELAIALYYLAEQLDLDVSKLGRRAFVAILEKHGKCDGKEINPEFLEEARQRFREKYQAA